jgi:hypothetical protein
MSSADVPAFEYYSERLGGTPESRLLSFHLGSPWVGDATVASQLARSAQILAGQTAFVLDINCLADFVA